MKRSLLEIWKLFDEHTPTLELDDVVDGIGCDDAVAEAALRRLVGAGIFVLEAVPTEPDTRTWRLSAEAIDEPAARQLATNAGLDLDAAL